MKANKALLSRGRGLNLRFPLGLDPAVAQAALDGLSGLPSTSELILEVAARGDTITHGLWVPASVRSSAASVLDGVIGSVRLGEMGPLRRENATVALRLSVAGHSVLSSENATAASRSLLAGLAGVRDGEQVILRWALAPGPAGGTRPGSSSDPGAQEVERAWRRKVAQPGFTVSGLLIVHASKGRAIELAGHVRSVIRARRGQAGAIRVTRTSRARRLDAMPGVTRASGWLSNAELLALLGWPLGSEVAANVAVGSRELRVARRVPSRGRRLFIGRDSHGERPVALDATAARHHMLVCGPSGVGKSVLLTRCVLDDLLAGYGGVVIDPKGDLVDGIVERVPAGHADRIAIVDPGDASRPLPGLAVLFGGDPDARAEVFSGALKSIFGTAWGVRSEAYGRLAIRTLSEVPGASLADMGRLFFEEPFRRSAVARLRDPFLISSWQSYESLSPGAQAEHVQAPMARVMTLLSRPRVRAILASAEPKLDVGQLLEEKKWLLVSLAPGVLGEAGATLVGAALMYVVWSSIEARVTLAPEQRHPVFIYADELATLTNGVPFGFELLAERARGLGAGLTVALQTLERVGEPTRSALLGNAATFISFRAGATEASLVARQLPGLSEADVMALGRFEVAARVGTGAGSSVSVVTGRTEPLPPPTGQAERIRDRSAARYGTAPARLVAEPVVEGRVPFPG